MEKLRAVIQSAYCRSLVLFVTCSQPLAASDRGGAFHSYCITQNQGITSQAPAFQLASPDSLSLFGTAGGAAAPFIDAKAQVEVLDSILTSYLNLYLRNRPSFPLAGADVEDSHLQESRLLFRHLCVDQSFEKICPAHEEKVAEFFAAQMHAAPFALQRHSNPRNEGYLSKVEAIVGELRQLYGEARQAIDDQLAATLFVNGTLSSRIASGADLKLALSEALSSDDVQAKVQAYHASYLEQARSAYGGPLLAKSMRRHIEGRYFKTDYSELLRSVEELSRALRHDFAQLLGANPQVLQLWNHAETLPYAGSTPPSTADLGLRDDCVQSLDAWFGQGDLYPGSGQEPAFEAVAMFHGGDLPTLRFLLVGEFMRAIWRLKEIGDTSLAATLEAWVEAHVMPEAQVRAVLPLGGGFTTTKRVYFPYGVSGVYKVKTWRNERVDRGWQFLMDSIVSRPKKEIVAYKIDRYLGINLVPMTKAIHLAGGEGSLQYFINHAIVASQMNEVEASAPSLANKWSVASARTQLPREARLFDWLIDNGDRNLDNYVYTADGQLVLIDHGWTFVSFNMAKPSEQKFLAMIPRRQVYEKLKDLAADTVWLSTEIEPLLRAHKYDLLQKRIKHFVARVERLIAEKGEAAVFPK